jgi:flagellar hook-associated protein 1 FlgK
VPSEIIQDSNGTDITSQITGGSLAGTLQFRNQTVPGLIGDTQQTGSLNQLAQGFADRVNTLLTGGQISSGPPAVAGQALFQYSSQNPGTIAQTLSVTGITGDQIATIDPGPPSTANGIAEQISNLSTSSAPSDQINGLTFPGDYGQIAAGVGQQLSNATTTQTQQSQAVAQAQNMLSQVSGVSLDTEAVQLTDFQNAYEATSKMVTILNDLTETTINLIPS